MIVYCQINQTDMAAEIGNSCCSSAAAGLNKSKLKHLLPGTAVFPNTLRRLNSVLNFNSTETASAIWCMGCWCQ